VLDLFCNKTVELPKESKSIIASIPDLKIVKRSYSNIYKHQQQNTNYFSMKTIIHSQYYFHQNALIKMFA